MALRARSISCIDDALASSTQRGERCP